MDKCILATGSFARGHEFYGPFDSPRQALDWADGSCRSHDFTIVPLEEPKGYEGSPGQFVLLIGDGLNGHSIVGTFHCGNCALDWEYWHNANSDGYNVLWAQLQKPTD